MEDKVEKHTQTEQQNEKKKFFLNQENLRNILDNVKHNNIHIMGIPEGEDSKQGIENLFREITTESVPNLVKEKKRPV